MFQEKIYSNYNNKYMFILILIVYFVPIHGSQSSAEIFSPTIITIPDVQCEPNNLAWELSDRFNVVWKTVDLAAKTKNPLKEFGSASFLLGDTGSFLEMVSEIHVVDHNGLVALDKMGCQPMEYLDVNGFNIEGIDYPHVYYPCDRRVEYTLPSVRFLGGLTYREPFLSYLACNSCYRLDTNQVRRYPPLTVKGFFKALYADTVLAIDIPANVTSDWKSILHDIDVKVTKSILDPNCHDIDYRAHVPGFFCYQTLLKSDEFPIRALQDPCWEPTSDRPLRHPQNTDYAYYVVYDTQLLDEGGNPLPEYLPIAISRSQLVVSGPHKVSIEAVEGDDGIIIECTGVMYPPTSIKVKTIRHMIAVEPYEVNIPFVNEGVSLPDTSAFNNIFENEILPQVSR